MHGQHLTALLKSMSLSLIKQLAFELCYYTFKSCGTLYCATQSTFAHINVLCRLTGSSSQVSLSGRVGSQLNTIHWRSICNHTNIKQCTVVASLMYFFKYNQQDATLYNILYYCQCSTCFRRFLHPSSGAQKLYTQHRLYVELDCCYR